MLAKAAEAKLLRTNRLRADTTVVPADVGYPKGVNITSDPDYLAMAASEINDRPRKISNRKKPSGLFTELVEAHGSTG